MATIALLVFILVFVVIILGENSPRKLDRPAAALIGAVVLVNTGVVPREELTKAVDFPTLALLFGMMIIVHYATISGLLNVLTEKLVRRAKSPAQLLILVALSAGILSALFVNDTICLLMTPIILEVCRKTELPAEPYLICLATSSNVGSAMTITGNPQNMLIGQCSPWTWGAFAAKMAPIGLIGLAINALLVWVIYRSVLKPRDLQMPVEEVQTLDKKLAVRTIIVTIALLVGFLTGAPMDSVALTAAVVILVWANEAPEKTFASIDWSLLLFFAGLFIVVYGFSSTQEHVITAIIPELTSRTETLVGMTKLSLGTIVGSNVFGNVPFVMLITDWVRQSEHDNVLWLILAMSSTFAGNLTLVGSVANLIVANGARGKCPLNFWTFMKVGVPSTVLTTLVGVLILYLYQH